MVGEDEAGVFRVLTAGLPDEAALWRAGALDEALWGLLARRPAGRLPAWLPAGAVAAVLVGGLADLGWCNPLQAWSRLHTALHHVDAAAGVLHVRRFDSVRVRGGDLGIDVARHAAVDAVVYLDVDPPQWLAARVWHGRNMPSVACRRDDDPVAWLARRVAADLRASVDG